MTDNNTFLIKKNNTLLKNFDALCGAKMTTLFWGKKMKMALPSN